MNAGPEDNLRRHGWNVVLRASKDLPLPRKLAVLLVLAVVGGCGVGMLEAHLGHRAWPAAMGLGLLLFCVLTAGQRWIWRPYEKLLRQLNIVRLRRRAAALRHLPVDRRDEVGSIARCIHEIGLVAIQKTNEAQQLRRTLDQRIKQATHQACSQLEQLAMRDPLTDLANRRFLEEQLEPLIVSVRDSVEDLACMVIDLDNFKRVNDVLGHAAGDDLLVFLAGLMRALVRREDCPVRLGGDEFAVFMPACEPARAQQVAQQLASLFRQHVRTTMAVEPACDLSIGIASLQQDFLARRPEGDAPTASSILGRNLLELADHRLYAAKRSGKGRIVADCDARSAPPAPLPPATVLPQAASR